MIVINLTTEKRLFNEYDKAYPVGGENSTWCYADANILHDTLGNIQCARDKGHTGPHRRYTDVKLYLWYDKEDAEKERVLEVCVKLGVVPVEE